MSRINLSFNRNKETDERIPKDQMPYYYDTDMKKICRVSNDEVLTKATITQEEKEMFESFVRATKGTYRNPEESYIQGQDLESENARKTKITMDISYKVLCAVEEILA